MVMKCKKCGVEFVKVKGLLSYCSLKCRNSRERSQIIKQKISNSLKGRKLSEEHIKKIKEKSLKQTKEVKTKISASLKKYFKEHKHHCLGKVGFKHNAETKLKLSISAKLRQLGGYNPNSIKKHKKGMYKGFYCDSSWELAWVIYNLEHNIKFQRNKELFVYKDNKRWMPDFILEDGTYVEIKGYFGAEAKNKIESFTKPILVIKHNEIKKYLDYVVNKYGKDFVKLYAA